jgi:hypothetical protein
MTAVAMRVLVVLGYLLGVTETVDGEAVGRAVLIVAGLIVTVFLFYLALRDPAVQLLQGTRSWGKGFVRTTASAAALARATSGKRLLRP